MSQTYRIDLITFESEGAGTIYLFEYKVNSKLRRMRITAIDLEHYFLEAKRAHGITKTNVKDFMSKTDAKYQIDEVDVIKYLHDFHNVIILPTLES